MINNHYVDLDWDSGKYAEQAEIKKMFTLVKYDEPDKNKRNSAARSPVEIIYDKNGNVIGARVDARDTSTITVSMPGAGKTRRFLVHYILSCLYAGQNIIVHDPKGEILGFFKDLLEKLGYKVMILDLRNPKKGDRRNPLLEAARIWKEGNHGVALRMAKDIATTIYMPNADKNDMFWTESSINLFLCYFTIAATIYEPEYVTFDIIYRIHISGMEMVGAKSRIMRYLDENKTSECYQLGIPSFLAPNDTRTSIYSTFSHGLQSLILNDDVADLTTGSSINIDDFATETDPVALFMITRDEAPKTYSTLVSTYVDTIYQRLVELAHEKYNGCLKVPVHFILEEFGNLSRLENINSMMTSSRSRNIRLVLVLQSLAQLYLHYSREEAHVLIGNAHNLIYMASTDMELVEMISKRCGMREDPYTGERRPLLSPDRLMHFDKESGETLMLMGRNYPYITYLPDLSQYNMVVPTENLTFPDRERIPVDYGVFAKTVDEIISGKPNTGHVFGGTNTKQEDKNDTVPKEKRLKAKQERKKLLEDLLVEEGGD